MTAGTAAHLPEEIGPTRVEGTLVKDRRTFGILRFDGPGRERRRMMECYDAVGVLLWSHALQAQELRVKGGGNHR